MPFSLTSSPKLFFSWFVLVFLYKLRHNVLDLVLQTYQQYLTQWKLSIFFCLLGLWVYRSGRGNTLTLFPPCLVCPSHFILFLLISHLLHIQMSRDSALDLFSHDVYYFVYTNDLQLCIPSPDLSTYSQTYKSNCLLDISPFFKIAIGPSRLKMFKINLLIIFLTPALHMVFPIWVNDSSLIALPETWCHPQLLSFSLS